MASSRNAEKFRVAEKYRGLEENVWVTFAVENRETLVDLGQGYPDYTPSPEIVDFLAEISKRGTNYDNHQYSRAYGNQRLVEALGKLYGKLIGRTIDPFNEVIVTVGAYGALFCTIMGNINPEDEVIIIEPAFDCYATMVKLAGGTPVFIPLKQPETTGSKSSSSEWTLDMDQLRRAFNAKTKAIILNTPNNPLGKVLSRKELIEIGNICEEYDVLIISDEVYEWIVYDGNEHVRISSLENFWDRTITIGSAGKTFSLTGWKIGWAYGPKELMKNVGVAHQNCTYGCQTPEQIALALAFEKEIPLLGTSESFFRRMIVDLTEKRKRLVQAIEKIGAKPIVPEGGYFLTVDWKVLGDKVDLSNENQAEGDDFKFAYWLIRNKKLVGIPPSAFYSNSNKSIAENLIRFNFHKKMETIEAAEKILNSF